MFHQESGELKQLEFLSAESYTDLPISFVNPALVYLRGRKFPLLLHRSIRLPPPPTFQGEPNHSPLHQIPLMSLLFWHFSRHFWSCVLAYSYPHHRPISPLQSQIICLDLLFGLRSPMFVLSLFHFAQLGLASLQTSFGVRSVTSLQCRRILGGRKLLCYVRTVVAAIFRLAWLVCHVFLFPPPWGRNAYVTNEPQRASAGKLSLPGIAVQVSLPLPLPSPSASGNKKWWTVCSSTGVVRFWSTKHLDEIHTCIRKCPLLNAIIKLYFALEGRSYIPGCII